MGCKNLFPLLAPTHSKCWLFCFDLSRNKCNYVPQIFQQLRTQWWMQFNVQAFWMIHTAWDKSAWTKRYMCTKSAVVIWEQHGTLSCHRNHVKWKGRPDSLTNLSIKSERYSNIINYVFGIKVISIQWNDKKVMNLLFKLCISGKEKVHRRDRSEIIKFPLDISLG